MTQPPPLPLSAQGKADADHLKLLAIFHFVVAGLAVIGLCFLLMHFAIMNTVFTNPEMWENQENQGPPPEQFFAIFKWFYAFFGVFIVAAAIGNLFSGLFIKKRKNRVFSLVVAGVNCLQFPFGTALGVFTFVVLLRSSVREIYEAEVGII